MQAFLDFLKTAYLYYGNAKFRAIDLSLLKTYLFHNPYRVSKTYLKKSHAENVYAYGETPPQTMDFIAKRSGIKVNDIVYELGCGRGRAAFWLACFTKCKVVGIDYVPFFIQKANLIKKQHEMQNCTFICDNFLNVDLTQATVIYLNGTCLSEEEILLLMDHLRSVKRKTQVVTTSFALSDYAKKEWQILQTFQADFTWGSADVFIQIKMPQPHS